MADDFDPLRHPILFATPLWLTSSWAWAPHIPLAMLLVDLLRPGTIVEVGTSEGDAYCALCQAVRELGLETRCHAVGAWRGAGPAPGAPAEALRAHHDALYGGFSRLMSGGCEAALACFPDGGIDLLHVDGAHGCGSAERHLDGWLAKMSGHGVVLLHGTRVSEGDSGLAEVWERRRSRYAHWELAQGRGLGLLAVGEVPAGLAALLEAPPEWGRRIRRVLGELGRKVAETAEARAVRPRLDEQAERIGRLEARLAEAERRLAEAREAVEVGRKLLDRSLGFITIVDTERSEYRRETERLKAAMTRLEGEMQRIVTSRSWRYTRPLRSLRTRFARS